MIGKLDWFLMGCLQKFLFVIGEWRLPIMSFHSIQTVKSKGTLYDMAVNNDFNRVCALLITQSNRWAVWKSRLNLRVSADWRLTPPDRSLSWLDPLSCPIPITWLAHNLSLLCLQLTLVQLQCHLVVLSSSFNISCGFLNYRCFPWVTVRSIMCSLGLDVGLIVVRVGVRFTCSSEGVS